MNYPTQFHSHNHLNLFSKTHLKSKSAKMYIRNDTNVSKMNTRFESYNIWLIVFGASCIFQRKHTPLKIRWLSIWEKNSIDLFAWQRGYFESSYFCSILHFWVTKLNQTGLLWRHCKKFNWRHHFKRFLKCLIKAKCLYFET